MSKPATENRSRVGYRSYIIGFVLSLITTLLAYFVVVNKLWSFDVLVYVVLAIAVAQLITQVIFFLHIGRGSRWKLISFIFTVVVVAIVVVGSIWVMHHMDYNMMHMTPEEQFKYMQEHEGI